LRNEGDAIERITLCVWFGNAAFVLLVTTCSVAQLDALNRRSVSPLDLFTVCLTLVLPLPSIVWRSLSAQLSLAIFLPLKPRAVISTSLSLRLAPSPLVSCSMPPEHASLTAPSTRSLPLSSLFSSSSSATSLDQNQHSTAHHLLSSSLSPPPPFRCPVRSEWQLYVTVTKIRRRAMAILKQLIKYFSF
jgi:hypothetical protein